uniref:DNA ligase n=1 Tax=Marseillevirus LCMAC103 TaxID=2506604 RepID=A0A481YWF7_9VIRU|nr:MAG: ATP-dependent DNA ligase [Marseillevirus LCMAC103]
MNLSARAEVKDPHILHLPVLYTQTKTGASQMYKVWVQDDQVHKTFGQVGGKLRLLLPRTCAPKNVGRANETTAHEQAVLEAERNWVKKLDKGYNVADTDVEGKKIYAAVMAAKAAQGGTNHGVRPGSSRGNPKKATAHVADTDVLRPMHAEKFENTPKCLKYFDFKKGVYAQPKFDGIRCVAKLLSSGEVSLSSRTGKQFPHFKALRGELATMLAAHPGVVLDGEIYTPFLIDVDKGRMVDKKDVFSIISGAASHSRKEPSVFESQMEYHVFDALDKSGKLDQAARFALVDGVFRGHKPKLVKNAPRRLIHSLDEMFTFHADATREDYEGTIIRAHDLRYTLKHRELKLRKHKDFSTDEFRIVGACQEGGANKGAVVWRCKVHDKFGNTVFDVPSVGTLATRRQYYVDHARHIGSLLTIRYQELGSNGIPRFLKAVGIRTEFEERATMF